MKKNGFLVIMLIVLILPFSFGRYPEWSDQFNAKSTKDPIYIEMEDSLPVNLPATARIYINDEFTKKEANYIEIFSGTGYPYTMSGEKVYYDSSGAFRQTLPYHGESVIEFGFRPEGTVGSTSSVSVTFYNAKKIAGDEWPDTTSEGSELQQYNCNSESNDLFCPGDRNCIVCAIATGVAIKDFVFSGSTYSVSVPGRFAFKKFSDTNENARNSCGFDRFTYSNKKTMTYSTGMTQEIPDEYSLEFDYLNHYWNAREWGDYNTKFYENQGYIKGECSEKICEFTKKYVKKGGDWEPVSASYVAYIDLTKNGVIKVTAGRSTGMAIGSGDAEAETVISEARAFALSYSQLSGKPIKKEGLKNIYSIRGNVKEEQKTTSLYVWGSISDTDANPMPYISLEAQVKGRAFKGRTDETGDFMILLDNLELEENENDVPLRLLVDFDYMRDGKHYFNINDRIQGTTYRQVIAAKNLKIISKQNVEVHFRIDGSDDPDVLTNLNSKERLKHLSVIYYHMHEAVDFALTKLKANIDYQLPVDVFVGNDEKKTHYDPSDSKILIASNVASITAKDRPKNREYHEFGHHVMRAQYGGWPANYVVPGHVYHDGFMNPTTGDSWVEGFAEFFAMAVSKEMGDKKPSEYAYWGDLEELNYKPWDGRGKYEEFAVASLLWDMYDSTNEKGDSLTLSLEDIWSVIKVNRADLYEYYKAFKQAFPKKSKEIDELFIMHGMFADTTEGNKKYDTTEPFRWINQRANRYVFIDLANNDTSKIAYKEGMVIGKATNYERMNRTSAAKIENAFLKVDPKVDFYKIKVSFNDPSQGNDFEYEVDARQGEIYLSPLPNHVDAQVTVEPITQDYKAGSVFSENSKIINSKIYAGEELKHDFKLSETGTKLDKKQEHYAKQSDFTVYDPILTPAEVNKDSSKGGIAGFGNAKSFKFPAGLVLLFVLLGIFAFFFIKKPGFRKKVVGASKKAAKEFKDKGIPLIKKGAKKTAEYSVKTGKFLIHHTKRGYHKAKPHIKKAHENVKKSVSKMMKKKES